MIILFVFLFGFSHGPNNRIYWSNKITHLHTRSEVCSNICCNVTTYVMLSRSPWQIFGHLQLVVNHLKTYLPQYWYITRSITTWLHAYQILLLHQIHLGCVFLTGALFGMHKVKVHLSVRILPSRGGCSSGALARKRMEKVCDFLKRHRRTGSQECQS